MAGPSIAEPTVLHAPDRQDLQAWNRGRDEAAFARIVQRHAGMVRALCERRLGAGMDADEATQAVFIVLARRAEDLRDPDRLGQWLYGTALRVCQASQRSMRRRAHHEREAATVLADQRGQHGVNSTDWSSLRPHLDEAIASLSTQQRDAVVCRLLQGLSYTESAQRLGISEDAVRKRVEYGVGKLRSWFNRRGIGVSAAVILAGMASESHALEPVEQQSLTATALAPHGSAAALADNAEAHRTRPWLLAAAGCAATFLAVLGLWWTPQHAPPAGSIPTTAHPPAAPWLLADLSPAIAACATASPSDDDPLGIGRHLGDGWHQTRPVLRVDVTPDAHAPRTHALLTGGGPLSPLSLLSALAGSDMPLLIRADALRPIDARTVPPLLTDEILRLSIGCIPARVAPPSLQLLDIFPLRIAEQSTILTQLPAILARIREHPHQAVAADLWESIGLALALREEPGADAFARAHWGGDVTLVACRSARGSAAVSLVLGLGGPLEPDQLLSAIPTFVPVQPLATPGSPHHAWRLHLFNRPWTLALSQDRLVLSELPDIAPLLETAATAPLPLDGAACAWMADLPALAALDASTDGWSGLLDGLSPRLKPLLSALRQNAPIDLPDWLGIDGSHQPRLHLHRSRWQGAWWMTSDGFRAEESGPPILATALAAAAMGIAGVHAAELIENQRERRATATALLHHLPTLNALRKAMADLEQGIVPSEATRHNLSPLFHGSTPTLAELQRLAAGGVIRPPHRQTVHMTYAAHLPSDRALPVLFEVAGTVAWSTPLDDDWSAVGLIALSNRPNPLLAHGPHFSVQEFVHQIGIIRTALLDPQRKP